MPLQSAPDSVPTLFRWEAAIQPMINRGKITVKMMMKNNRSINNERWTHPAWIQPAKRTWTAHRYLCCLSRPGKWCGGHNQPNGEGGQGFWWTRYNEQNHTCWTRLKARSCTGRNQFFKNIMKQNKTQQILWNEFVNGRVCHTAHFTPDVPTKLNLSGDNCSMQSKSN